MKRPRMRRLPIVAAVLVAGVIAVAAGAATNKVSLTLWSIQAPEAAVPQAAAKNYKAANVKVQIFANDPYKQKIRVAIGANKAPDIFFNWGGGILKSYVDAGKVLDLTPYLKADKAWKNKFFGNVLNSAAYNGHYYGIPNVGMQPVLLFYNKKIFAANKLTPPTTWAELLNVVAKLKSAGVTPMILGGQSKWPDLMWEEYLVDRFGGPGAFDAVVAGKKNAWSNPAFIKANTAIQQLVDAGAFGSNFDSVPFDGAATATLLGTGKGAMELMGSWEYASLLTNTPDAIKNQEIGFMTFPSVPNGSGNIKDIAGNTSNFYSVAKNSKNKAAAVAFLKAQMMNTAYVNGLIKLANIPPVKGIAPKLAAAPNANFTTWTYRLIQNAPHFQYSWDQVLAADPANTLLTNLDQLFLKQITPEQFSANMNKTIK
jgi:raffinose/stachyose/melibiose transport system substrate-binding protein